MSDEYDRGIQDQRLQGHDDHFEKINGSQAEVARQLTLVKAELVGLRMDLQRLTDAVDSNQRIVATTAMAVEAERKSTAEAVENQRTTLRDTTEKRWSPLSRVAIMLSAAVAVSALITWLISLRHG